MTTAEFSAIPSGLFASSSFVLLSTVCRFALPALYLIYGCRAAPHTEEEDWFQFIRVQKGLATDYFLPLLLLFSNDLACAALPFRALSLRTLPYGGDYHGG